MFDFAAGSGEYDVSTGGTVVSATGTTKTDYADLAWATQSGASGGAVWDLNQLRSGGNLADSFSRAFTDVKVEEVLGSSIVVLGKNEGTFDVCAYDEVGTRVVTAVSSGGDYLFDPSGRWSPDGSRYFGYGGQTGGIGALNPYYPQFNAYSLVAEDSEYNSAYQLSLNPELPIYFRDLFIFKMNDTIGGYDNNAGCLTVKYTYKGSLN